MSIETIAGLCFGAFLLIVAFVIVLIKGLSTDPDAWMDRHAKYYRAQKGGDV